MQTVIKNLLPIYHKQKFANYIPNYKALIVKNEDVTRPIRPGLEVQVL